MGSEMCIRDRYVGILGGNPIVVQNTMDLDRINEIIKKEKVTRIIISPGPRTPKDAGISNKIIEKFKRIPTLGVCLGHQCIAHVFGGKIRRAKTLMHGKTSLIEHNGKGILNGIPNPLEAVRYHSLVVDDKTLPQCLEIIAKSLDDDEIMGLKHRKYEIYGLQFHPESILTRGGIKIIENFLGLHYKV